MAKSIAISFYLNLLWIYGSAHFRFSPLKFRVCDFGMFLFVKTDHKHSASQKSRKILKSNIVKLDFKGLLNRQSTSLSFKPWSSVFKNTIPNRICALFYSLYFYCSSIKTLKSRLVDIYSTLSHGNTSWSSTYRFRIFEMCVLQVDVAVSLGIYVRKFICRISNKSRTLKSSSRLNDIHNTCLFSFRISKRTPFICQSGGRLNG